MKIDLKYSAYIQKIKFNHSSFFCLIHLRTVSLPEQKTLKLLKEGWHEWGIRCYPHEPPGHIPSILAGLCFVYLCFCIEIYFCVQIAHLLENLFFFCPKHAKNQISTLHAKESFRCTTQNLIKHYSTYSMSNGYMKMRNNYDNQIRFLLKHVIYKIDKMSTRVCILFHSGGQDLTQIFFIWKHYQNKPELKLPHSFIRSAFWITTKLVTIQLVEIFNFIHRLTIHVPIYSFTIKLFLSM